MLFRQDILQGIAEGRVTLAFRRWKRAPPAAGSSLRSPAGVLCLDRVTVIEEEDITPDDVRRTGMSVADLRESIAGEGTLLRIELRLAGADPRVAVRERLPEGEERGEIVAKLARTDAASGTPWTTRYLQLIADQPGIVSGALARKAGTEVPLFKRRVRQLKELGLTESLDVGYRISPRGRAVLESLRPAGSTKHTRRWANARTENRAPASGARAKRAVSRQPHASRGGSFDPVEAIGRTLPDVEVTTTWGQPTLKVRGRMFVCIASHKSAEPDTLVVMMDIAERDALIEEDPETYYLKEHYVGYPCVLVRLARVHPDALRGLVVGAHRYVGARKKPSRS